jgi:hypothetical protein
VGWVNVNQQGTATVVKVIGTGSTIVEVAVHDSIEQRVAYGVRMIP